MSPLVLAPSPTACIYVLIDPRNGEPRYVGQSEDPERRLRDHLAEAKAGGSNGKSSWIRGLLKARLMPGLRVIVEVPASQAFEVERWFINGLGEVYPLTNGTHVDDSEATQQSFSVRMPKKLHKTLRLLCLARGIYLNDVLVQAAQDWLQQQPDRQKYEALAETEGAPE